MIDFKRILSRSAALVLPVALSVAAASCDEDISDIGNSLTKGEVSVTVDSLVLDIDGRAVKENSFDSRGNVNLIGSLNAAEYGSLACGYVTRLLPAVQLNIPDSITAQHIDSMRIVVSVPRGRLAGDSLVPQQLKIYPLTKQLPADISSSFDPTGYYDPDNAFGSRSYTLSMVGASDSLIKATSNISIPVKLPKEMALKTFEAYRAGKPAFQWPAEFAKFLPGIFVEPTFGMGAVANVSKTQFVLYYHYTTSVAVTDTVDGKPTVVMKPKNNSASVPVFSTAPEVLSSNSIRYIPAQAIDAMAAEGRAVLTTPGGYKVRVKLPMERILKEYNNHNSTLTVINNLSITLPVRKIANDYGILPPPYLLLVKSSEADSYFRNLKKPDGKTSFYAEYNEEKGVYAFSSMRELVVALSKQGSISADDCDYTIIPVDITTEKYTDPLDYTEKTMVTSCEQYYILPKMCELDTRNTRVVFTYSQQTIN